MIDVTRGTNSIQNPATILSAAEVYVINLCASMTPMPSVPRSLKGYENHRLYQVTRVEDGRHRYRLRLGFFISEADAEIALASLRSLYPAAFTSRAGAEDMRYSGDPLITGRFEARPTNVAVEAKAPVLTPIKPVTKAPESRSVTPAAASSASSPTAPIARASVTPPAKPVAAQPELAKANSVKPGIQPVKSASMSLLDPPAPTAARDRNTPFTMTAHQPFHVARGVNLPDTDLELAPTLIPIPGKANADPNWVHLQSSNNKTAQPQPTTKPKAATPALPVGKPVVKAAPPKVAAPVARSMPAPLVAKKSAPVIMQKSPAPAAPIKKAAAVSTEIPAPKAAAPAATTTSAMPTTAKPTVKPTDDYIPILDTTMTIRTISATEMEDANQPKWFSVQLAISEQAFNLDAMPRLDIFAAYRIYSVAINSEDGKPKHSLRLGFFKEEVSADAVAGYLKTFFPAPTITRVGVAEYERFIEPKMPEPVVESKVVALSEKRDHGIPPSKPTFGVTPAPTPTRPKQKAEKPKWETQQPGYRPGPTGKYSVETAKKNQANLSPSDSGIRKSAARPQSFLSKLIGRELD